MSDTAPRQISTCPLVLCTDRLSPSLDYRPFSEPIDGIPFLRWWRHAVHHTLGASSLHVLVHTSEDERAVRQVLGEETSIIRCDAGTTLAAYVTAARTIDADHVAFVSYGFAFAPDTLLSRVFAHHLAHANLYTPIVGFPPGAVPQVFATTTLTTLARLRMPGLPSDPVALFERLVRVGRNVPELSEFGPRSIPFDAAAAFEVRPSRLPQRIRIATPRDVAVVRRAIAIAAAGSSPTSSASTGVEESSVGRLLAWRQAAMQMRDEDDRALRQVGTVATWSEGQPRSDPSGRKRRILFIAEPAGFSGAEESLCQVVAQLDRDAFDLFAWVGGAGVFSRRLCDLGVHVTVSEGGFGTGVAAFRLGLATLASIAPDVIHFNAAPGPPLLHAVATTPTPIVMHCLNGTLNGDDVEVLRIADRVIALTAFVKEKVLALEVPEDRVSIIHDEVDPTTFRPGVHDRAGLRRRFGIPDDAQVVLMIARFAPNKRHDLMLGAAVALKARFPRLHVVLKGDVFYDSDPYDQALEFIGRHGMEGWVTIVPFVDDIRTMHALADALVLCSDAEALGRCVVEAMAMELPVIVTDSGGTHEIVRDRETGFVVPGGHVGALGTAIAEALSDPIRAREMGRAARRYVLQHLTAQQAAAKVAAIYDELTAEPGTAGAGTSTRRTASRHGG